MMQIKTKYLVNKFCSKNPNLRSLSRIDKGVIALAHTLEQEYHGGFRPNNNQPQKKNLPQKAMSVILGKNKHEEKTNNESRKPVKKSKTGRIHTEAKPLADTGLRLAMLKKVIPFHYDDFMTLSQNRCMWMWICI